MTLTDVLNAVKTGEISQVELASRSGLSTSAISQICSSTIRSPRYENAVALINALTSFRQSKTKTSTNQDAIKTKSRKSAKPASAEAVVK